MHYHAEVWIKDLNNPEGEIEQIMKPHREDYEREDGPQGFWDWFQIGGRYTESHTPDYDPSTDPRNIEKCTTCNGTGFRNDNLGRTTRLDEPSYTCNGCGTTKNGMWIHGPSGPGYTVKWPTQWAHHHGDIIPVSEVDDKLTAYTLIVEDKVFHTEEWNGKDWIDQPFKTKGVKQQLDELGITNGYPVTVDYHC